MLHHISVCVIKIEVDSTSTQGDLEETGAVSTDHPAHPRVQKERERDRGLRFCRPIFIETYSNQLLQKTEFEPALPQSSGSTDILTTAGIATDMTDFTSSVVKETIPTSLPRERTPLDLTSQCGIASASASSELPKEIGFFSGNPSVEVTNGIIHLYKKNERKESVDAPSNQLCLLAVPASLSCHDLLTFVAPCHSEIQHIRIVRDGSPNQFMVLLEFRTNVAALEFYQTFNGAAYNSLEPDSLCHAVWVSGVERADDGLPPVGHTELPTCPVCLERMDESVDGVLTILCNHAFHANCLVKWGDSTCPVCRHVQTPELIENSVCMECEGTDSLWICLICGHVGCGRYQGGHAAAHYRATNHIFAMQLGTSSVWDYAGDNFVHRLFQNKTDGKLVSTQAPNDEGKEKIDSMQLEFTYLLTSQLDTQRKYYEERLEHMEKEWHEWRLTTDEIGEKVNILEQRIQILTKEKQNLERKLSQNNTRLKDVQKELAEERQITNAFKGNQNSWHLKYKKLEEDLLEYKKKKEAELKDAQDQLRDIMFYMEAQSQIAGSELKDEIVDGTVIIPEVSPSTSSRRNRKNKRNQK